MADRREYLDLGVALQQRGNMWWVDIYRHGKRIRQSVGPSRSKAMQLGWAVVTSIEEKTADIENDAAFLEALSTYRPRFPFQAVAAVDRIKTSALVSVNAQDMIREAVRSELGKTAPKAASVATVLADYLKYQKRTSGKRHAGDVESVLEMFIAHAGVENIGDITRAHVEAYLASIAGLSPKTEKNRKIIVSAWLGWALENKHVTENVAAKIKTRAVKKQRVVYHSADELDRIIKAAHGHTMEALILTAIYTGMRASELLKMEGEDIDFVGQKINVKADTKTGFREVPLMAELLPALMKLPRTGKLFAFKECGAFRRTLSEVWMKARLTGKVGLQILRHSWVTHLLLAGRSNYDVARMAGHNPMVQEKHYAGYKLGDTSFPMTCEKHGIGKVGKAAKAK